MDGRRLIHMALLAALPLAAGAHHSFAAFDMAKNITIEGTVVAYKLENPHAHLVMQVDSIDGKPQPKAVTWDVEGQAANIMRRQGWGAQTVKPGEKVKVVGHPLHTGDPGLSLFYLVGKDGKNYYGDIARPVVGNNAP